MSEINEIKINPETPGEYIIRFGQSAPIELEKNIKIFGTIDAPFSWASKKTTHESHIVFDYSPDPYITIEINERNQSGNTIITGRLIQSAQARYYTPEEKPALYPGQCMLCWPIFSSHLVSRHVLSTFGTP